VIIAICREGLPSKILFTTNRMNYEGLQNQQQNIRKYSSMKTLFRHIQLKS